MNRHSYKILLIYPPSNWTFWNFLPEGISRLTSYLKSRGLMLNKKTWMLNVITHIFRVGCTP